MRTHLTIASSFLLALLLGAPSRLPALGAEVRFHLHYDPPCCDFPPLPLPGDELEVPLGILASVSLQGFSVALGFSAEALEAVEVEPAWVRPDGKSYEFFAFEMRNDLVSPFSGFLDGGSIAVSAVISSGDGGPALPPAVESEVLRLRFRVRVDSPWPVREILGFLDAAPGPGAAISNAVIAGGEIITPETAESFWFLPGHVICACPDPATFVRGDANGDLQVDVSDPIRTLGFLFAADPAPPCADAADANDDGVVDISDPIATVSYLFLGSAALPAPYPLPGRDKTADALSCLLR